MSKWCGAVAFAIVLGTAQLVTVSAGAATNLFSLAGHVTGSDGGNSLAGICLQAYGPLPRRGFAGSTTTDGGGHFVIPVSRYAKYSINLVDCNNPPRYLRDTRVAMSQPLGVRPNQIKVILTLGGRIAGTLYTPGTHDPAPRVCITVTGAGGGGRSDNQGHYVVDDLVKPGQQLVIFWRCEITTVVFGSPQYSGGTFVESDATRVTVVGGQTTDVSLELLPAATVSGVVTNEMTGLPANQPGCVVAAVSGTSAGTSGIGAAESSGTDSVGHFAVQYLPANVPLILEFQSFFGCHPQYYDEYWDNANSVVSARQFTLTMGESRTGFDAALAPKP